MVAILGFSKEQIRQAVTDMYTRVARSPGADYHFPVGANGCRATGYGSDLIHHVPEASIESYAGVGCPHIADVIRPGDKVLDVGSGSGTDALIAANRVTPTGRVFALDATAAMREKLEAILAREQVENIEIIAGDAESIPLPDESVDVVTSNGVLNLVPGKRRAIDEIFRVLKPGGHAQIADTVIHLPVTADCKDDPALWAECVVGASIDEVYLDLFRDAGFEEIEILAKADYFEHSPSEETREVAARFGGHAIVLRMRRAARAPARIVRLARRLDPRRMVAGIRRHGFIGLAAVVVALFACYGTLALSITLPLLGIGFTLDTGAWAGAIVATAALAAAAITAGQRKHGSIKPAAFAMAGLVGIVYVMVVDYTVIVEAGSFVLLIIGALLDTHYRRSVSQERARPFADST